MSLLKNILKNRILTNTIIIAILVIVFSMTNEYFFTFGNMRNIIFQSCITIVMSFAMTFVILTGAIDLSLGAVAALSSIIMVTLLL